MDAAQRLLRTLAFLSVIALLMAAPGWATDLTGSLHRDDREIPAPPPRIVTSSGSPTKEITFTVGNPRLYR